MTLTIPERTGFRTALSSRIGVRRVSCDGHSFPQKQEVTSIETKGEFMIRKLTHTEIDHVSRGGPVGQLIGAARGGYKIGGEIYGPMSPNVQNAIGGTLDAAAVDLGIKDHAATPPAHASSSSDSDDDDNSKTDDKGQ
ncbi:MAG: hypothetical protein PVI37_03395 [Gammaproteobacteria bacterium]|jgi:hypothetical protein